MEGNICARCLEKVIGDRIQVMRSVGDWSKKCKICGDTAVFYARKDELEVLSSLDKPLTDKE